MRDPSTSGSLDDRPESALFFAFLRGAGISEAAAARALATTQGGIYRWHRVALPTAAMRLRIQRWSRGRVPATSWLRADERAAIDATAQVPRRLLRDVDAYLAAEAARGAL